MTFRSFSRFVRWYRWELRWLVLVVTVAVVCGFPWEARAGSLHPMVVPVCLLASLGPAVAYLRTAGYRWPGRVLRRRAAHLERMAARLRSQPLRGWTR